MMRIALFTPYLPYPPDTGGKIRSYYLLRALTTRFTVDLYTVYYGEEPSEVYIKALQEYCHRVILFHLEKSWRTRDRIQRALAPIPRSIDYFCTPQSLMQARGHLANGKYDLIIADEICMTPYSELAPSLPRVSVRQKVDHIHYSETARARPWGLEKLLDFLEAVKLRQYERTKMPCYQACVACSQQDAALIQLDAPELLICVIPNGVDLEVFVPSAQPKEKEKEPTLLYVGSMYYYPNIDAMRYFFEAMYKPIRQAVPNVRIRVVGHAPSVEIQRFTHLPGVEMTGTVPDVRPYYEQATLFVAPLRLGGGTRLKIVEAMAMGLPVVSTSIGAEGLEIHPGEDILIANDTASFIENVLRLLTDPELRDHLAKNGRLLARQYDWRILTKPYLDLIETVAKQWWKWSS